MFSKITDKMSDEKLQKAHFIVHMVYLFCITICVLAVVFINYTIYKSMFIDILILISILFSLSPISKMRNYKSKNRFQTECEFESAIVLSFGFILGTLFSIFKIFPLLQYKLI